MDGEDRLLLSYLLMQLNLVSCTATTQEDFDLNKSLSDANQLEKAYPDMHDNSQ